MKNEDLDAEILIKLFEDIFRDILEKKKVELEFNEEQIRSFNKIYIYLFALVYGNSWKNDPDELAQKIEELISTTIGGA